MNLLLTYTTPEGKLTRVRVDLVDAAGWDVRVTYTYGRIPKVSIAYASISDAYVDIDAMIRAALGISTPAPSEEE